MTKDIIDRLTIAVEFGGVYAFEKALNRLSQRYSIYTISDYPFNRFEVVGFVAKGDNIVVETLLVTSSIDEAIEHFAEIISHK